MSRERVSPGQLYTTLSKEFRERRPAECQSNCRMPPLFRERPSGHSANWRIGIPTSCVHGCHALIVEVAAHYWPKYDLMESGCESAALGLALTQDTRLG